MNQAETDEMFRDRKPCWLVWVVLKSGHTALRAVCLSKGVADHYEKYIQATQQVERVMVEESRTNHLYFGMLETPPNPDAVKAALKRARTEYAKKPKSRRKPQPSSGGEGE